VQINYANRIDCQASRSRCLLRLVELHGLVEAAEKGVHDAAAVMLCCAVCNDGASARSSGVTACDCTKNDVSRLNNEWFVHRRCTHPGCVGVAYNTAVALLIDC
jgi:hypothetical protein